ncbi:Signal transduction histidine kinase [Lentzea waywayandensis]|uniref:histidine kinase n=1 Tax=Lentzea waywayandensis TaxID=84724 RepID=A0A1I6DGT9_9PSEU|nr:histidine kinase [Lentzea waywayandensis]SFR04654.1 Signal transduction histidine kinase [Lentzea waywayandensis]
MRVHHRPFVATVIVCAAVFVITGLSNGFSRAFFQDAPGVGNDVLRTPLVATVQAVLVLGVAFWLAWKASVRPAVVSLVALELVSMHATWVSFRFTYLPLVLVAGSAAVAAGLYMRLLQRSRAENAAAAEERARRDERLDMARELHDVVAHHVTGMLVQAQAALVVAEQDKDKACAMLPGIVDGGTDALGSMSAMVRTLRDNGAATATTDLTADLHRLAERSGLPVRTSIELTEDVRPELGRSVLRIVQEALTNARKHAFDATSVEVDVRLTGEAVLLSVVDNGTVRPTHSGGFGLVGMRERVHELGGRFFAGSTGEGWLVTAELPREVRA